MNANELIDVIDKIYFITDKDKKKYPILNGLVTIYKPFSKDEKITISQAIDYANKCNAMGYTDWRLPYIMGKTADPVDFNEIKKHRWIDNNFRPTMSPTFIKEKSELAAIIDGFSDALSMSINYGSKYLSNSTLSKNGCHYLIECDTKLCDFEVNEDNIIVDFVLVR